MEESCRTFIPTHNLPFSMLSYHPTVVISYITQKQINMLILHLIYVKIISCRQIIISVIIDPDDRALEYQVYFFTAVFLITSATILTDLSIIESEDSLFQLTSNEIIYCQFTVARLLLELLQLEKIILHYQKRTKLVI
jgi:hypothetical protein